MHDRYGGVVPEVASRHHLELVNAVVDDALHRAGADARRRRASSRSPAARAWSARCSSASATAKALAAARRLPLAPVDHLQGHVAANFLEPDPFEPPFLCLIACGGHTLLAEVRDRAGYELLGQTLDDAAGEAFDKGARMLGLGYPGGPALERLAAGGRPRARSPSRRRAGCAGLDFSFAGLKTALLYRLRDLGDEEAARRRADLAASYQHAIVEALALRVERALRATGLRRLAIGGGVAANGPLRERCAALGVRGPRAAAGAVHRQRRR